MRTLAHTSAGARNWVEVDTHDTIGDAVSELKNQGMQVLVTHLSDSAVDFREIDYTKPTAIILGGEKKWDHSASVRSRRPRHHHSHGRYGAITQCFCRQCFDSV